MKRILYHVVASLLLLTGAGACALESVRPQPEFFVKANKNGAAWIVPGDAVYDKARGEFYVFGAQSDGTVTQAYLRLGFTVPPKQPLTTAVQAPALPLLPATWTGLVGGDVLVDSYTAASLADARLLITRLDTVRKIMEGTFEAHLRRDARWSQQSASAKLDFTEGSFRVRYQ